MLIFGYGSLVNIKHLQAYLGRPLSPDKDFWFCRLHNYRRCWTAAMDNRLNVPGYKYYVARQSGDRPTHTPAQRLDGFVTFLNIRSCPETTITGIVFEVSSQELVRLDQRERNYRKVDVTNLIDVPMPDKVYAYIGLAEAEQRYQRGLKSKNAMISQDYYDLVYGAYESLGTEALTDYLNTTDSPVIPIVALDKKAV